MCPTSVNAHAQDSLAAALIGAAYAITADWLRGFLLGDRLEVWRHAWQSGVPLCLFSEQIHVLIKRSCSDTKITDDFLPVVAAVGVEIFEE